MNRGNTGIDVLSCVQGNTARKVETAGIYTPACVVYDFDRGTRSTKPSNRASQDRTYRRAASDRKRRSLNRRKRAAKVAAARRKAFCAIVFAFILVVLFGIGGIASRAQSKKAPDAYKYYDTITVAYKENLLDIVQRYDDRNYYETQFDYVRELCRINNLEFDGTSFPTVAPGTHLIVPYYSTELK